ncbi:MAG: GAP family protein [Chloroflexota bacterium]|nr:MAG: GAP family protein [Chloroflexota bacterium]
MPEMWLDLLPIAIAMAITPGRLIALILLFHTRRPISTSLAFVGGMASNMLIEGLAFALLFSVSGIFAVDEGAGPPAIVAILFVIIGVLMLVGAARVIFQADDEEKAPPKWLAEIDSFTPGKAYKLGLGWLFVSPKQWIFTLTAVAVIFAANLEPLASLANYLLFILIVLMLFFLLILVYAVLGDRSKSFMDRLFGWLKKNARTILILVLVVFGLYFLIRGATALAA